MTTAAATLPSCNFGPWLESLPKVQEFASISDPRRFAHDEAKYDAQYGNESANHQPGRGLVSLLKSRGVDTGGGALEVGCGTGLMSLGLAEAGSYPVVLLTDPSPQFLRITREKLARAGVTNPNVRYAVMMAEDLHKVPAGSLSLVSMRSTLHHVSDVDKMIADAARALRPGGALVVQEPCWEGYVLMGAMAQFMPAVLGHAGVAMSDAHRGQLRAFVDTMRFYARRDVDKSAAEDKHLFKVDELMRTGARVGLETEFLPNSTLEDFAGDGGPAHNGHSFTTFFRDYLRYCMSFDPALVDLFKTHMDPYCRFVEDLSAGNNGPYMHGVFLARKA